MMSRTPYPVHLTLMMISISLLPLLLTRCELFRTVVPEQATLQPDVRTIVVMGFFPALSPGDEPGVIRGPLSGAVHMAYPVLPEVIERMTDTLFSRMVEDKRYELVSPGQARGVLASLLSSDTTLEESQILIRIGNAFSSDGVLTGYIYRWLEREGTDYAVHRPASVAFDLYLVRTTDGAVLWKGSFDKSQQSLTENLLDFETFVKAKGKWLTADLLAEVGLVSLMGRFPGGQRTQERGD
ncbi:MAG: hypothetical protein JXL84_23645 [Deltaproteobacteria bacterium]|nr:hypothetical protein [Deltaproteobacteria bacterium]